MHLTVGPGPITESSAYFHLFLCIFFYYACIIMSYPVVDYRVFLLKRSAEMSNLDQNPTKLLKITAHFAIGQLHCICFKSLPQLRYMYIINIH